ncbi:MAG: hypothetical protein ACFFCI_18195 [Promethearchaeota archaeon]
MIFMVTQWTPYHKTNEWLETFKQVQGKIPSFIKKWQTFATTDEDRGIKGYNLIMVEKGNADEAMIEISKLLAPFWKIEGFAMKTEPILSMRDALKIIGASL